VSSLGDFATGCGGELSDTSSASNFLCSIQQKISSTMKLFNKIKNVQHTKRDRNEIPKVMKGKSMSQQVLEICLDWPSLGREELDMHSD
jgi:hypothetical protein